MFVVHLTSEFGKLLSPYAFSTSSGSDHGTITGASVIQGRGRGLHPGGVAAPGPRPEGPVPGRDAGELQEPGVSG